jgi:hypothetical protein
MCMNIRKIFIKESNMNCEDEYLLSAWKYPAEYMGK